MSNGEDPQERPDHIRSMINGLERYNPEAANSLEAYLQEQCEKKFCDCNSNRALLKLYQLNPDKIKDEVITNILVKSMTQFPSAQFDMAMHLLSPHITSSGSTSTSELSEAVSKLRALNAQLEGAQYARFWATLDSDDLYADLTTDISGFEDMIRVRIAQLISQAFREVSVTLLEGWLGLDNEAEVKKFAVETCGWKVDAEGLIQIPKNVENEAKKTDIREDVNVEMFSRVIRRSWEETV